MSSMNENLLDKIARADFSMETDFKSVLRKRLFGYGICGRRYGFSQAAGTEKEKREESVMRTEIIQLRC